MAVDIFISYARDDEALLGELEKHLAALLQSGQINIWHDRKIQAGDNRRQVIGHHLETAQLILVLISPDFMASPYHQQFEMRRALERHHAGSATVVPILLRPFDWRGTSIHWLEKLPSNDAPVIGKSWNNQDQAWLKVTAGIRRHVERTLHGAAFSPVPHRSYVSPTTAGTAPFPGSSPIPTSRRLDASLSPVSVGALMPASARYESPPPPSAIATSPRAARRWMGALGLGVLVVMALEVGRGLLSDRRSEEQTPSAGLAPVATSPSRKAATTPAAPAPQVCCGGAACTSALQDTRQSICEKDGCVKCGSGRPLVTGACREPLGAAQRWKLRLAHVKFDGIDAASVRVCVRLSGDPAQPFQCTAASDAADSHPETPGPEMRSRLSVITADLLSGGRGLDIQLEVAGVAYPPQRPTPSGDTILKRSALCQGAAFSVPEGRVTFYLDDDL